MPPASRITDNHVCPKVEPGPVPHVGGPVVSGEVTVLIGYMPAARIGDTLICVGPPDSISAGESTVIIGNKPASRLGDGCSHGGKLVQGCPTVNIGSSPQAETLRTDEPFCEECERAKKEMEAARANHGAGELAVQASPRVILEVLGGPLAGTKTVLGPGERLRVGSRTRADLVVPDEAMAPVHFILAHEGNRCRLLRHPRAPEILLGGERSDAGVVPHGGWIRAGGTDFLVHREAATPAPVGYDEYFAAAADDELPPLAAAYRHQEADRLAAERAAFTARRDAALARLAAEDGPRFAVLDAARSPRIRTLLRESPERCRSLYDGIEGQAMAHVAPFLVELPPGSDLLRRIVHEGWEKRWGVFIDDGGAGFFDALRRHLRRFLMIADADADSHRRFYFRFYDPVVLQAFLPTCTTLQRQSFFGPVRAFYAEGSEGEGMARFEREGDPPDGPPATLLLTRAQRQKVGDPAFVDRVFEHFRRFHLEDVYLLPDLVLRRRIRHGIDKGRSYGITWEYGLTVFVAHMIRINPAFDQHPAVQRALRDPARSPDIRIDTLINAVSRREWEEAAHREDPDVYWRPIDEGEAPVEPARQPPPPGGEE